MSNTHSCIMLWGVIGIGKTTTCKLLKAKIQREFGLRVFFWKEPLDLMKALLEEFYRDPKRWSFALQQFAYSSKLRIIKETNLENYDLIIGDAHPLVDRHGFTEMLHDAGLMSDLEYNTYIEDFESWKILVPTAKPTKVIFLEMKADEMDKTVERIKKRGRDSEKNITIDYLKNLQLKITNLVDTLFPDTTLKIDSRKEQDKIVQEIFDFIKPTLERVKEETRKKNFKRSTDSQIFKKDDSDHPPQQNQWISDLTFSQVMMLSAIIFFTLIIFSHILRF
jgi:deoxyadenosine/deoxycytidine kinase